MTSTPVLLLALALVAADTPKPSSREGEAPAEPPATNAARREPRPPSSDATDRTAKEKTDAAPDYEALLNDRMSKGVTPESNANVLLWKAFGPIPGQPKVAAEFFRRLGIAEPPKDGEYFISLYHYFRDRKKYPPEDAFTATGQLDHVTRRPWAAADFPHVAGWLDANEKPLAVVAEAVKRPDYYGPILKPRTGKGWEALAGALMPGLDQCRTAATALAARAMLRVAEGKADAAWQDLLVTHRLGRLVARGGTLIEFLVGVAIDQVATTADLAYLERADPTAAQILARMKDLRELPPLPPVADKVDVGERYQYLDTIQLIRMGGETDRKMTPAVARAWATLDWEPAIRDGNRWYDRMVAALRKPTRAERLAEFRRMGEEWNRMEEELKAAMKKRDEGLIPKLFPGIGEPGKMTVKRISTISIVLFGVSTLGRAHDVADRAEQAQRNHQVAFALAAYRRDAGRYPAKLGDLSPKYLKDVPNDLFTDKELVYRPGGKGYVLYSVGVNGKDEDGRDRGDDPPGDDLGVRMPLPKLKESE